jgi:hypothetical protein
VQAVAVARKATMTLPCAIRPFGLALALATVTSAHAAGPVDITGSAGLMHRRLVERSVGGPALLTETGPVAHVRLHLQRTLDNGTLLGLRVTGIGGDLHYDGQTQAGAPLVTTTRHLEGAVDVLWRPWQPAPWGEAWLTGGWLGNRRDIRGTATAGGLLETSSAVFVGAMWRTPPVPLREWRMHVELEGRASVYHRLHVDYQGLLDESDLRGAQRKQVVLRLQATPPNSAWSWTLEYANAWQGASDPEPVYRGGVLFGTVRQPEMSVRDVGLRITRRF